MSKLLSFHNDPVIKQKYIDRIKAHQEADEIIKGQYWENGKGCAVGCTIEGSEHNRYETELGIPEILAQLEDGIFENLPNEYAKTFPLKFIESIPVGVDLSRVLPELVIWEWEDETYGLKNIPEIKEDIELVDCCEQVVSLYKRVLNDEKVSDEEWMKLEDLAYEIERAGAWAWAWARAWARARARAWAWAWARAWARARARAVAWAWARAGAEFEEQMIVTAEKLLDLLSKSK